MTTLLQAICFIGALVTMIYSINAVTRMSSSTDHVIRSSYVLICTGAFGELVAIVSGHIPGISEVLFVGGYGLLSMTDRRVPRCPLEDSTSSVYARSLVERSKGHGSGV